MSRALFIIESPFQALCAFEAIEHFNIEFFDFHIPYMEKDTLINIETILNRKGVSYSKAHSPDIIRDVLPLIVKKHKHYNKIFIGYYFSLTTYAFSVIHAAFRAKIFYLDDGTQALEIFNEADVNKRFKTVKANLLYFFFLFISGVKLMAKSSFFTIYNVASKRFNIIKNNFSLLSSKASKDKKGVFIMGTNPSALDFRDHSYEELFVQLHKYIKQNHPKEPIYYCPHRRDLDNETINALCKEFKISMFNTEVSVEYDFTEKNVNPALVIGFTSNALFTLKKIYPNSLFQSIAYNLTSDVLNDSKSHIENIFKQYGIALVDVYKL